MHKEIDTAIQQLQSEIEEMDSKHLVVIEKTGRYTKQRNCLNFTGHYKSEEVAEH